MAKPVNAGGPKPKRPSRPLGPRNLWIILKPGTDPQAVRELIENVTFNGREVLKGMEGGSTPAVIKFTIHTTPRQSDDTAVERVEGDAGDVAAAA